MTFEDDRIKDDPMDGDNEQAGNAQADAAGENAVGVDAVFADPDATIGLDFQTAAEKTEIAAEELLRTALSERDEYLNMAQRIQAEFENYKRRNQSVRAEAWDDGARETIALMLPVIDNLERALDASKEKTPFRDGLELIYKQMIQLLEKRGVTEINRPGEPFDPELENAVMQAEPSEGEPGTVCTVLQKGYKTASRVIRYAMVRVVPGD